MQDLNQGAARLVVAFEVNSATDIVWSSGHVESCTFAPGTDYDIVLGEGRGLSPNFWVVVTQKYGSTGTIPFVVGAAGVSGYGEPATPLRITIGSPAARVIAIYESTVPPLAAE